MIQTPICILGAGPAGAAAALRLSRLGQPCVVVDKAVFPREKICGDGISHRVVGVLKRWVDADVAERFAQATHRQLGSWGLQIEGTKNNGFQIDYAPDFDPQNPTGFVCKRWEFDAFLAEEVAQSEHVQFLQGVDIQSFEQDDTQKWHLISKDKKTHIIADLVIVADGAQSRFARQIGGIELDPKHYMASVRAYYKGVTGFSNKNLLEFYFLKDFLPGYFWIFPLPNGEANVGIAIVSEEVSRRKLNLKNCLEEVLADIPKFKTRFENAERIGPIQGFGLPLASKKRTLSGPGYMLVGDAASLIDPLTGEGIANALLSGAIAGIQAADCVAKNDFSAALLRGYDARLYRMRGQEFKVSYWLQKRFKNEWFFNTLVALVRQNKTLARTLAYVFNDTQLSKQLWKPSFWIKNIKKNRS